MARVAVIVSNPCTIDARVIKMARAARDAGHEVHVFGTLSADTVPHETLEKITYHRLEWRPAQIIIQNSPLRFLPRVLRLVSVGIAQRLAPFLKYRLFSGVFARHVAGVKPDIIHAHDLICLRAGIEAGEMCGAPVVYDAHELEVHRNPPLPILQKQFVSRVEKKYGARAAAVITVGRMISEVLGAHLGRKDVNVLYNSPLIEPCQRHIRSDLAMPDGAPLIIYVGKVTMGRGVSEILSLLPKLKGVTFATVGPCDDKQRALLMAQATRQGVADRFRILPPVPFEQVVDYISGADAGVISVEPVTLSYQYCMPNKLFEMSFADVPIISNKLDEIEEFLAENGNGKIVDFEDQADLVYSIFRLFNELQIYRLDSARRAQLQAKYSWEAQIRKLLQIYDNALASRSTEKQASENTPANVVS